MKNLPAIVILFLAAILFSCKKEKNSKPVALSASAFTGKWSLVSDSTYTSNMAGGNNSHVNFYVGKAGDTYTFGTDGYAIIHVGGGSDTAHYTVDAADNRLQFFYDQPGNNGLYYYFAGGDLDISHLTSHSATLTSSLQSPGGFFGRVLRLSR